MAMIGAFFARHRLYSKWGMRNGASWLKSFRMKQVFVASAMSLFSAENILSGVTSEHLTHDWHVNLPITGEVRGRGDENYEMM